MKMKIKPKLNKIKTEAEIENKDKVSEYHSQLVSCI